ncbi:MAG: hypothetical protein KC589_01095 [Nanoarchaeota archaeon]|nr:hypothetical protein [Nanoarchaeota archaeon]
MTNTIKPFGWKRNLDSIKETLIILFKTFLEYKTNGFSAFLIQIFYASSMILLYYIINLNFSQYIPWKFEDFLLFLFISFIIFDLGGFLLWDSNLFVAIKKGTLNTILSKPINPFLMNLINGAGSNIYVYFTSDLIILPIIIWYFDIQIVNISLFFIFFLLVLYLHFIFMNLIQSFEWRYLGISNIFMDIFWKLENLFDSYPEPFFRGSTIYKFLFLFPSFFVGSLLVPTLRGYEVILFNYQISILIFLIILFTFITYINWRYGLKHYEAFG